MGRASDGCQQPAVSAFLHQSQTFAVDGSEGAWTVGKLATQWWRIP